jgi:hypothetical protein
VDARVRLPNGLEIGKSQRFDAPHPVTQTQRRAYSIRREASLPAIADVISLGHNGWALAPLLRMKQRIRMKPRLHRAVGQVVVRRRSADTELPCLLRIGLASRNAAPEQLRLVRRETRHPAPLHVALRLRKPDALVLALFD